MTIKETEVKVFIIQLICDQCETGEMIPTGQALMSNPPQFTHVCNRCGAEKRTRERYPRTDYRPV